MMVGSVLMRGAPGCGRFAGRGSTPAAAAGMAGNVADGLAGFFARLEPAPQRQLSSMYILARLARSNGDDDGWCALAVAASQEPVQ